MVILLWLSPLLLLLVFGISWVTRDSYVYREQRVVGGVLLVCVGVAAFTAIKFGGLADRTGFFLVVGFSAAGYFLGEFLDFFRYLRRRLP